MSHRSVCEAKRRARFSVLLGDSAALNPDDESSVAVQSLTDQFHQARHPVDGKLMTFIDAGVFLAGEHNEPVWLPAFYIDVFPTTNVDYQRFTQATGHPIPQHWTHNGGPDEATRNDPVTFVTWHDATAYAAWAAKALPTAHQWERSARGSKGDVYPWGNQLTPAKANAREGGLGHLTPVSRYHSGDTGHGATMRLVPDQVLRSPATLTAGPGLTCADIRHPRCECGLTWSNTPVTGVLSARPDAPDKAETP